MKMHRTLIIILIIVTILPYSILGFPKHLFAQASRRQIIRVSPVILPLQLSPNKATSEIIVVENLLEIPVPIRIDAEDLSLSESSDLPEVGKNDEKSIADWVSLPTSEFILAPREKKEIPFSIQTPSAIPLGGYQAMIFIQPFFPQGEAYGSFLTSRIGIVVIGSVGTAPQMGNASTLQSFSFPFFLFDPNAFEYSFSLKSRTLYHFTARPHVTLTPLFGKAQQISLDEKLMFPGKARVWEGSIPARLSLPGWYSVDLQISVGNGQKIGAQRTMIFIPPPLILLLVIALITMGIMWYSRRRLRNINARHNKLKG